MDDVITIFLMISTYKLFLSILQIHVHTVRDCLHVTSLLYFRNTSNCKAISCVQSCQWLSSAALAECAKCNMLFVPTDSVWKMSGGTPK